MNIAEAVEQARESYRAVVVRQHHKTFPKRAPKRAPTAGEMIDALCDARIENAKSDKGAAFWASMRDSLKASLDALKDALPAAHVSASPNPPTDGVLAFKGGVKIVREAVIALGSTRSAAPKMEVEIVASERMEPRLDARERLYYVGVRDERRVSRDTGDKVAFTRHYNAAVSLYWLYTGGAWERRWSIGFRVSSKRGMSLGEFLGKPETACPKCGARADGGKFCSHCGTPLSK
jgi:hypothetical protein